MGTEYAIAELGDSLGKAIDGLIKGGGSRLDCHSPHGYDCRIYWVNEVLRVDICGLREKSHTTLEPAFKVATAPFWEVVPTYTDSPDSVGYP